MTRSRNLFLSAAFFMLCACGGTYRVADNKVSQTRIKADSLHLFDSAMWNRILPYKQKLDAQMNEVIAATAVDLKKEQPEGTLNNLVADATMWYAGKNHDRKIDCCILNYGGIRIPSIPKGNITLGKVYELMPFDNLIEVLEISGTDLIAACNWVAANGGWPVSGVTFKIRYGTAVDIRVNGEEVNEDMTYTLVTSDYLANGGDKCEMLKKATKRTSLNYKLRDAIIDYLKDKQNNKVILNLQVEGRIGKTE